MTRNFSFLKNRTKGEKKNMIFMKQLWKISLPDMHHSRINSVRSGGLRNMKHSPLKLRTDRKLFGFIKWLPGIETVLWKSSNHEI